MQNNHKLLALLFSLILLAQTALSQSASRPCSHLQQTPLEALIQHDEPLCRLGGASSCERIPKFDADTIFIGTVIRLEKADGFEMLNGECSRVSIDLATVNVKESFTGPLPETVVIHAGMINGYYFKPNEAALIFAHKNPDGTFSISGCGGTESLTEWYVHGTRESPKAKEDIAYLRSRSTLSPTARIFGSVSVTKPETDRMVSLAFGFADQHILVSGPVSAQIQTSKSGEFELDDLPPGKYLVRVLTSKKVSSIQSEEIEVPAKSCARLDFYIESEDDYRNVIAQARKANHKSP